MDSPSLLVVDDDEAIRKVLLGTLEAQSYHVSQACDADEAMALAQQHNFDLVLTDYQMPSGSMDGLELLSWLRQNTPATDVILMTGFASMDNSILALRRGAFDYLIKPIAISQVLESVRGCLQKRQAANERLRLIAQMEAMLEQLKGQHAAVSTPEVTSAGRILEASDLIIDRKKRLVVHRGQQVTLTATEFDMLEFLAAHSERVVTAQELIRSVQGYDIEELDARPIVRVNMRRLRQKIETDPNHPEHILTVRTHGYRFVV
jgi:DNA-binding response OmpR family regulator